MNRNNERHFLQVPQMHTSRTRFNRDQTNLTTFNSGELIPFFVDEVLPGDTFQVDTSAIIRMTTPKYPVMDDAFIDFYYFYCPNRILWDNFKQFMGEVEKTPWMPTKTYKVPRIIIQGTETNAYPATNSILDYMGVPTKIKKQFGVNALPIRAYVMIWNEFFRDQNVGNAAVFKTDDADVNYTDEQSLEARLKNAITGGRCLPVNRFHDYFSSCLPYPQRGPEVTVPLTGNVPVGLYKDSNLEEFGTPSGNAGIYFTSGQRPGGILNSVTGTRDTVVLGSSDPTAYKEEVAYLGADLNAVSGVSIQDLRMAIALQHIFEADARNGTRYREFLSGTWGVTSPDSRLQIPEYIGGQRIAINVNQVVQTSQTDPTTGQALGNTAAYSLTTCSKEMVDYAATEYGYIIGLAVVRVEHSYQQGLATKWTRGGRFTYYDPRLAALGEQPVYNREIYAQGTAEDNEIFGYQEAWADYRYKPSYVTGEMRSNYQTSLDAWHYADYYDKLPRLSAEWIQEGTQNIDRTIAVTSAKSHQFLCDFYFTEDWYREMPIYSIPGIERI